MATRRARIGGPAVLSTAGPRRRVAALHGAAIAARTAPREADAAQAPAAQLSVSLTEANRADAHMVASHRGEPTA